MNEIDQQVEEYLRHCEGKGLSQHSIRAYRTDLNQYLVWLAELGEDKAFSKGVLQEWLHYMRANSMAPKTMKRRLASIHAWGQWMKSNDLLSVSEILMPKVKVPRALPRNLTRYELSMLFQRTERVADDLPFEELLTAAMVETLFQTGMRVGEACALRLCDYDSMTNSLRVMGKGMRERKVYVVNKTSERVLNGYLSKHPMKDDPTEYFFVRKDGRVLSTDSARRLIAKYSKRSGLQRRITPHMLRHSAATELLSYGADIRSVQKMLGHSSLAVTEIYTHVSDDGLRDTLSKINPRASIGKVR